MLLSTHSVISVLRRVARACGGGPARVSDGMLGHTLSMPPTARRGLRMLACARILGALVTDRSPERWLPPLIVNAPPRPAHDLCSLG
jgi:hypothetical protein